VCVLLPGVVKVVTRPHRLNAGRSAEQNRSTSSSESAGTSVTANELKSPNEAVNALEPLKKWWQGPGRSADEHEHAHTYVGLAPPPSTGDQKQRGVEEKEELGPFSWTCCSMIKL